MPLSECLFIIYKLVEICLFILADKTAHYDLESWVHAYVPNTFMLSISIDIDHVGVLESCNLPTLSNGSFFFFFLFKHI